MEGDKDGSENKKKLQDAIKDARIPWKKCVRCGVRMKAENLDTGRNECCNDCKKWVNWNKRM